MNRYQLNDIMENETSLVSSTKYIDWLDSFTKEYNYFTTDIFRDNVFSSQVKQNIFRIKDLYRAIEEYAEDNYIIPVEIDNLQFYSIQHNGVGYYIGNFQNKDLFYCMRLKNPEEDSLEFEYLMSTVKTPRTVQIEDKLEELVSFIEVLGNDIPVDNIRSTADTVFMRLDRKEKNSCK